MSLLTLGPEPQEQGSRLVVAPGLCSCTPSGDVRGLHVLPSVTPSGSALSLIQQVFESLPHLGVWRGQRTESRAQSIFHPWAAGTRYPFPGPQAELACTGPCAHRPGPPRALNSGWALLCCQPQSRPSARIEGFFCSVLLA